MEKQNTLDSFIPIIRPIRPKPKKVKSTEKEKKLLLKSLNKKKIKQVKNILEKDKEVLTRLSRL